MSLKKQLTLIIISLFILIFIGTFTITIKNLHNYLANQLQTQAQNTATTLGVTLSQYAADNDIATIHALINSAFDTGYYREIRMTSIEDKPIFARTNAKNPQNVPKWFIDIVPFDVEPAHALVTAGWKQMGTITVASHEGLAYQELWTNTLETFGWFFLSAVLTIIFSLLALHYLLNPLRRVKDQADAICKRNFITLDEIPRTKELRSVVNAMNKMSLKVQNMLDEQTHLTEKLREQAYKDTLTGLGNRRYFNMQLDQLIYSHEEFFQGALFLIELNGLEDYKKHQGYEQYDLYLNRVANILKEYHIHNNGHVICRIGENTFALVLPNISIEDAKHYAHDIYHDLSTSQSNFKESEAKAYLGVAYYKTKQKTTELLAEADMALRAAQSQDLQGWHIYEDNIDATQVRNATHWQELLQNTIDMQALILHFQPVIHNEANSSTVLHYEVLMRVADENGKVISAGIFIPMAENFELITQLDKLVITTLLKQMLKIKDKQTKFAINLSPASLSSDIFVQWLQDQLKVHKKYAKRLIFEIPEHGAINELEKVKTAINTLTPLGCEFSLDHFGRGFSSVKYLRNLDISYLKIDGSYTRHIDQDTENQFFVHVLTEIAHNLDIHVIAENIETQEEVNTLRSMNIDGLQGYLFGKPAEKPEYKEQN